MHNANDNAIPSFDLVASVLGAGTVLLAILLHGDFGFATRGVAKLDGVWPACRAIICDLPLPHPVPSAVVRIDLQIELCPRRFGECQRTRVSFAAVAIVAFFRRQSLLVLVHERDRRTGIVLPTNRRDRHRFAIPVGVACSEVLMPNPKTTIPACSLFTRQPRHQPPTTNLISYSTSYALGLFHMIIWLPNARRTSLLSSLWPPWVTDAPCCCPSCTTLMLRPQVFPWAQKSVIRMSPNLQHPGGFVATGPRWHSQISFSTATTSSNCCGENRSSGKTLC